MYIKRFPPPQNIFKEAKTEAINDKEVVTILRAVHKYKDSREQFEMRTHKRLIDVIRPTDKTTAALDKLEIPAGVDVVMEVK